MRQSLADCRRIVASCVLLRRFSKLLKAKQPGKPVARGDGWCTLVEHPESDHFHFWAYDD